MASICTTCWLHWISKRKFEKGCCGVGATAGTVTPAKRKAQAASDGGDDDVMSDVQKKVFMSRKERKVFDSLRKAEDAKAAKAETLRKKKVALAK